MSITRRGFVHAALVGASWPLGLAEATPFEAVPVVDLAVHLPQQVLEHHRGVTFGSGQADAVRLRRGGAYGLVLPLERRGALGPSLEAGYLHLFRALSRVRELRIPGCRRPGPGIRTWFSIADASDLGSEREAPLWVTRGVRFFGLVTRGDSALASSALGSGGGLSSRGQAMVRSVHAARGTIDVCGLSAGALAEVVALAREAHVPAVASHTAAGALTSHARNLSDVQLLAVAQTGGLIGVSFEQRMLHQGKPADLGDAVRHILHIARVAGVDHVGIGSGFESGIRPPHELLNAARYPRLSRALRAAGMPMNDVRKVMAGNALRLMCYQRPGGPQ